MTVTEIQSELDIIANGYPEELSTEELEELCDKMEEYLRTVNPNPKPYPK